MITRNIKDLPPIAIETPPNPFEAFQSAKQQQAAKRKVNEVDLWKSWKAAPEHEKPKHLAPLLQAYEPTFQRKINEWSRGARAIQPSAFKAELQKHFIGALGSYDPERAALSTHVEMRLQKAKRFVVRHQNLAYIPEGQVGFIGKIHKANDELTEEFGRAPTDEEIGDHIGITGKKVTTIRGSLKKDIPASMLVSDPSAQVSSREREILDLLPFNLTPEEKDVFDHLYGQNGKATIQSTNDLAKKLGKSAPQVSRLKTSILAKYKSFA